MDAGDHGVHFPVAEHGTIGDIWPVFDREVLGLGPSPARRAGSLLSSLGMIRGFAVKDADIAMVDVVVDAADGREIGEAFGDEFASRMGRGFEFVFDLGRQETRHDVGEPHVPALVLGTGLDVVLGDMRGVLPVFLAVVKDGLSDAAALDLPVQRAVRQAHLDGQSPQGKALVSRELEIAVVGHGDDLSMSEG